MKDSDLSDSIIAQLLEVALVARYGMRDPDGLQDARWKIRAELMRKGWTLPPYTYPDEAET
ncbi:hypothetical protein [Salipiger bermudensis]|uniref:hypothetical protein n=1 Tax=Salipiger bermudensis TaxID=344736 RepID=UPI001CD44443|nr:hypothetical protein [Salipiger bermudensis]MCA0964982.1 hypothetical protein [Salipiger bermudensis]